MSRTGGLTGGGPSFADAESTGNGLWILLKNGFSFGKTFVVFIGKANGADFGALAAACAFGQVYETGFLVNFCGEISGLAFKVQKFRIG